MSPSTIFRLYLSIYLGVSQVYTPTVSILILKVLSLLYSLLHDNIPTITMLSIVVELTRQ
nr:MAG TPA: hypothetical protein [Caudoviricetes sp.]